MNVAYLVTTTGRYHESRAATLLKTWGRDVSGRLLFLTDAPGPTENFVELPVGSDYDSAAPKLIHGLQHFAKLNYQDFDFIFVCDDDSFVFTENLEAFLATRDPNLNDCYCFVLMNHPEIGGDFIWPSGGAGYALSRAAFAKLIPLLEDCQLFKHSDVTVGMCLQRAGTTLISTVGLYEQDPEAILERGYRSNLAPHEAIARFPLSFHRIQPDLMERLYFNRDVFDFRKTVHSTENQNTP